MPVSGTSFFGVIFFVSSFGIIFMGVSWLGWSFIFYKMALAIGQGWLKVLVRAIKQFFLCFCRLEITLLKIALLIRHARHFPSGGVTRVVIKVILMVLLFFYV